MNEDIRSPLRRRLDEIQSRLNARHYREFDLEPQSREQAVQRMVDDLANHLSQRRDSGSLAPTTGVIVAESTEEVERIEQAVRLKLKERGALSPTDERSLLTLRNLNWRDSQKSRPSNYEQAEGLIARFNRKAGDFEKGEIVKITGYYQDRNRGDASIVMTVNEQSKARPLPISRPAAFDLYQESSIRVAIGEQIRCNEGGETLVWDRAMIHHAPREGRDLYRYDNGEQLRVTGFEADGYLKIGHKRLSDKFYHLEYGYAATPEQLPVRGVDKVLVHGETSLNHSRVREAMEQARDSVAVYRQKEPSHEPERERGLDRDLSLD